MRSRATSPEWNWIQMAIKAWEAGKKSTQSIRNKNQMESTLSDLPTILRDMVCSEVGSKIEQPSIRKMAKKNIGWKTTRSTQRKKNRCNTGADQVDQSVIAVNTRIELAAKPARSKFARARTDRPIRRRKRKTGTRQKNKRNTRRMHRAFAWEKMES